MSNLATWFNPSLQVMQRSKGRSAVAAAAYRSCTFLHDERVDIQHDYRKKGGHVSTELFGVEGLKLGIDDIGTLCVASRMIASIQSAIRSSWPEPSCKS